MNDKRLRRVAILEGLDLIRGRPEMYLGDATPHPTLLVRAALTAVLDRTPAPSAVRLLLWREGVVTLAFDGEPLPVAPLACGPQSVPHPELYRYFMHVVNHCPRSLGLEGAILNALCERLAVSTIVGDDRFRVVFGKGLLVSLLSRDACASPLGSSWMTFLPDASIVTGTLTAEAGRGLVESCAKGSLLVTFHDRTDEDADWF